MACARHRLQCAIQSGEIVFKHEPLNVKRRHAWENLPFLRGVLMLWDALNLGTRALNFSASVAISAEEDAQAGGEASKPPSDTMITITMIVSLLFGIGLFFILPTLLASLADRFGATSFVREGLKSLLQLGLFVGYIVAISRMPEVARLFGFHGAEHKTINAYEAGAPLTVERVREFTLIHPRCGTSFLLVVLLINWIVSFLLVRDWPLWARLRQPYPAHPADRGDQLRTATPFGQELSSRMGARAGRAVAGVPEAHHPRAG